MKHVKEFLQDLTQFVRDPFVALFVAGHAALVTIMVVGILYDLRSTAEAYAHPVVAPLDEKHQDPQHTLIGTTPHTRHAVVSSYWLTIQGKAVKTSPRTFHSVQPGKTYRWVLARPGCRDDDEVLEFQETKETNKWANP